MPRNCCETRKCPCRPIDIECLNVGDSLTVCGKTKLSGPVVAKDDVIVKKDLEVRGDLIVNGAVLLPLDSATAVSTEEQEITSGVETTVRFDTATGSLAGSFVTGVNGFFRAPVAGFYSFTTSTTYAPRDDGTPRAIGFSVNGGATRFTTNASFIDRSTNISAAAAFHLNALDQVRIITFHLAGLPIHINDSIVNVCRLR